MKQQSLLEEFLNSLTHGLGVALSVVGLVIMISLAIRAGDVVRVVSFGVYGSSLVLLYLISTLYHGVRSTRAKRVLRVCDHASIYLLIAGTYTPFCFLSLPWNWGRGLLLVLWPLAAVGIIFKIFYVGRYEFFSTLMYVLMGWTALIAIKPFFDHLSLHGFLLVLFGGLLYTVGAIFFSMDRLPFNHVIWHLFVMGGSTCHFFALLLYVLPLV